MPPQSHHPSESHGPADPALAHSQAGDGASGGNDDAYGAIGYEAADPSLQTAHWHEALRDPTTLRASW